MEQKHNPPDDDVFVEIVMPEDPNAPPQTIVHIPFQNIVASLLSAVSTINRPPK